MRQRAGQGGDRCRLRRRRLRRKVCVGRRRQDRGSSTPRSPPVRVEAGSVTAGPLGVGSAAVASGSSIVRRGVGDCARFGDRAKGDTGFVRRVVAPACAGAGDESRRRSRWRRGTSNLVHCVNRASPSWTTLTASDPSVVKMAPPARPRAPPVEMARLLVHQPLIDAGIGGGTTSRGRGSPSADPDDRRRRRTATVSCPEGSCRSHR